MKNELHVHINLSTLHHFSSHGIHLIIISCTKVMHFPSPFHFSLLVATKLLPKIEGCLAFCNLM